MTFTEIMVYDIINGMKRWIKNLLKFKKLVTAHYYQREASKKNLWTVIKSLKVQLLTIFCSINGVNGLSNRYE